MFKQSWCFSCDMTIFLLNFSRHFQFCHTLISQQNKLWTESLLQLLKCFNYSEGREFCRWFLFCVLCCSSFSINSIESSGNYVIHSNWKRKKEENRTNECVQVDKLKRPHFYRILSSLMRYGFIIFQTKIDRERERKRENTSVSKFEWIKQVQVKGEKHEPYLHLCYHVGKCDAVNAQMISYDKS